MIFYVVITVVSAVTFTADMILRYMEKIRSFGSEEPFHNIKGKIVPVEDFIPNNFTMLSVFFMFFGAIGITLKALGINGLIVFPCAVLTGAIANFLITHFLLPFIDRNKKDALTEKDDISGLEAFCTEKIEAEGYGKIRLEFKGRTYNFDALSANETDIAVNEKVYILYRQDNVCFVEKETEIISDEYFKE